MLYYMHRAYSKDSHAYPIPASKKQKESQAMRRWINQRCGDIIPDRRGISHHPPPTITVLAMTRNATSLRPSLTHILHDPPARSHIHMRTSASPADIPTLSQLYHDQNLKSATAKASKYAFNKQLNDRISIWRGDITKLEVCPPPPPPSFPSCPDMDG